MLIKKMVCVGALFLGLSAIAKASPDLFISNNTKFVSTSRINPGLGSICSSVLGSVGITTAGEQNHKINGLLVYAKCFPHTSNCAADIYLTENCEGTDPSNKIKPIGTVILDVNKGFISRTMNDPQYDIVANSPFNISLNVVS